MNDFAMCLAEYCAVSDTCRRHEDSGTIPDSAQSYAEFEHDEFGCDYYWSVED